MKEKEHSKSLIEKENQVHGVLLRSALHNALFTKTNDKCQKIPYYHKLNCLKKTIKKRINKNIINDHL